MRTRSTLAALLLDRLRVVLGEIKGFLEAPAPSARQPVPIPLQSDRRSRPGHPPGRYRRHD